MSEKGDLFVEREKNGGPAGYVSRILIEELKKAETDKKHPLRPVLLEWQRGHSEQAAVLLLEVLRKPDLSEPFNILSTWFVKIPATQEMLKYAVKNFDDLNLSQDVPMEIIKWAGIDIGIRESKAAGGRNKGKRDKKEIIAAWEISDKKISIPAFAKFYFHSQGGSYDVDGKKLGDVPSERTIASHLREYMRKKSTVF